MAVRALGYIGVETPRTKEWLEFGPDVLGMQVVDPADTVDTTAAAGSAGGEPDAVRLRIDDAHHRIALYPGERDRLRHLGWDVGDEETLERMTADLARHGVEATPSTEAEREARRVLGLVTVRDPAGIVHELYYGLHQQPHSFRPGRPLSGFVTGEQGLGHAVVIVPEMEPARAFVREVLGMHTSDEISQPLDLRFFHCNPRHHSLALAPVPGMRGLHHLMVQVEDLDDVGLAYDMCRQRGMPITMTLGRHVNDRMVSFYVRTPSGFEIEYGWGAREVGASWTVARYDQPSVWGHEPLDLPPGALEPAEPTPTADPR